MSLAPGLHSSQDASDIGVDRRPSELPVPCTRGARDNARDVMGADVLSHTDYFGQDTTLLRGCCSISICCESKQADPRRRPPPSDVQVQASVANGLV